MFVTAARVGTQIAGTALRKHNKRSGGKRKSDESKKLVEEGLVLPSVLEDVFDKKFVRVCPVVSGTSPSDRAELIRNFNDSIKNEIATAKHTHNRESPVTAVVYLCSYATLTADLKNGDFVDAMGNISAYFIDEATTVLSNEAHVATIVSHCNSHAPKFYDDEGDLLEYEAPLIMMTGDSIQGVFDLSEDQYKIFRDLNLRPELVRQQRFNTGVLEVSGRDEGFLGECIEFDEMLAIFRNLHATLNRLKNTVTVDKKRSGNWNRQHGEIIAAIMTASLGKMPKNAADLLTYLQVAFVFSCSLCCLILLLTFSLSLL